MTPVESVLHPARTIFPKLWGFPDGSAGEESTCNAGDTASIPGQKDPLEVRVATHSSILAGIIARTEETSSELQSKESQRARHD